MIVITNICLLCVSYNPIDFVGYLYEGKRAIQGSGCQTHYNVHIGTLKWHWEDDQMTVQKILIPQSYYVPEEGVRLLLP